MNKLGRYVVERCIAKGGYSYVFLAYDTWDCHVVVLKKLIDRTIAQRKEVEATLLLMKCVRHRGIVSILDWYQENNELIIIMEYVEGKTLMELLDKGFVIEDKVMLDWMMQVIDVLIFLHEQHPKPIYFVDIKPQNIICSPHHHLCFIDVDSCVCGSEMVVRSATKHYAPIDITRYHRASARSDIYSFGITFYVMLHGCFPCDEKHSHNFDELLLRCCERHEQKRFQDVRLIKALLQRMAAYG